MSVRVRDDGPVRVVTLDRPARHNAVRPADLDALRAAVTGTTDGDPSAGRAGSGGGGDAGAADAVPGREVPPVVLLRGAGDSFCAGADLDVVADLDDPAGFARHGQRVARAIETAAAVVIAGVDGAARGGGVELALACDLRVATPAATFAESGVGLGLVGAWGGTVRLPRIVGEGVAADLSLSGRVVDADEARRTGLVSRIVDDPRTVADEVAAHPPDALAAIGRLLRGRDAARRSTIEREAAEAAAFASLLAEHGSRLRAERDDG